MILIANSYLQFLLLAFAAGALVGVFLQGRLK